MGFLTGAAGFFGAEACLGFAGFGSGFFAACFGVSFGVSVLGAGAGSARGSAFASFTASGFFSLGLPVSGASSLASLLPALILVTSDGEARSTGMAISGAGSKIGRAHV